MKVILLEDVHKVGKAGEIKEVADGYARNFLIPKKLAQKANAQSINVVEARLKAKARDQEEESTRLTKLGQELNGKEITLEVQVGAKEQLHGSITAADIAAGLKKITGLAVDKRKIELAEPIRQLGSYEIEIKLTRDIAPKIKVNITGKEAEGSG